MEPGKLPDRADDRLLTHRSLLIVGVFASTVVLLVLVWYLIDVLLLVFAAVLLAIILRAPTDWLAQHTALRPPWALAVVIGWLFGATVAEQMGQLTRRIPEIVGDITKRLEQYAWIIQRIQPEKLLEGSPEFLGKGIQVITATFGAVAGFVIVIVMGVFLAAQPGLYVGGAVQLVPLHQRRRAGEVLTAVGGILRWWLLGQLVLMAMVGLLTGVGLLLLGVPLALALALLTGLLNFIPYLGPILAAVPAILVALAESPLLAGYVLVLYIGIQALEGNVLEPIVQQKAVYLPPAVILFAQIVLGILVGALGVMLATPLAAALLVAVKMLYVEDVLGAEPKAGK